MLWLNLSCKQRSVEGFTDDMIFAAKCEKAVYFLKNLPELL